MLGTYTLYEAATQTSQIESLQPQKCSSVSINISAYSTDTANTSHPSTLQNAVLALGARISFY